MLEKLPLNFYDACPNCGNLKGMVKEVLDELREQGKVDKDSFAGGMCIQFPLLDPLRPPTVMLATKVSIPILYVYLEVCKECGTVYCTKFELIYQDVPVQVQTVRPKGIEGLGIGGG